MRKLWSLLVVGILLTSPAFAGIIALNTISADATIQGINNNFNVIKNGFNGQVQGSATTGSSTNILAASIGVLDMGAEANPQTRDSELLGIGIDSTTTQAAYVYTGLTPATSATLTSNVSAGTAYINGYRVVKASTSQTYAASMDTYLDLSQTGVYTQSAVAVGGTAPTVAANSARLAKVTTSGTAITIVTDLAHRTTTGLLIPSNFRSGLVISRDSTATITVFPGTCEINNTMVSKTTVTTLTLTTAGDWAGGSSLQAVSTYGYVGIDTSGNLKLHTTIPAFQNYALTVATGKKRYASWSSTTYRILGWFYMNSTGSGQLNTYEVGNIKESDAPNSNNTTVTAQVSNGSGIYADDTSATMHAYTSGGPLFVDYNCATGNSGASPTRITISVDSAGILGSDRSVLGASSSAITEVFGVDTKYFSPITTQGTHTIQGRLSAISNTGYVNQRELTWEEK